MAFPAAGMPAASAAPRTARHPTRPPRPLVSPVAIPAQDHNPTAKPIRTVGSFWPYAPTLFDYIRRAMPQNAPQSLSSDDVYAVSAYILNLNGLLPADATLDARALSAIKMPNRDKFVGDPRPDVKNPECVRDCAASK